MQILITIHLREWSEMVHVVVPTMMFYIEHKMLEFSAAK